MGAIDNGLPLSGANGAVYFKTRDFTSAEIACLSGSITDDESSFVEVGYLAGDLILITGGVNDGTIIQVATVAAGTITFTNTTLTPEVKGTSITLSMPSPGRAVAGCQNWEVTRDATVVESTTFDSGDDSEFEPIRKAWSGTIDKLYIIGSSFDAYVNKKLKATLFLRKQTTPTAARSAIYYEGDLIITSLGIATNNNELIRNNVSFQGSGALTEKTQTSTWPVAST